MINRSSWAITTVALYFLSCVNCANYPIELPRCKNSDTECLKTAIGEHARMAGPKGIRSINLPPLDPYFISKVTIQQGKDSVVAVKLNFYNSTVYGLSSMRVEHVAGFGADPDTSTFELAGTITKPLKVIGKYDIDGRVLILPIRGAGDSEIFLKDAKLKMKFTMKSETRNGQVYAQVNTLKLDFDTSFMRLNLGNLFNGDKLLGDTTNSFLNANWRDIFLELKPSLVETFQQIAISLINNVFQKVPYKNAFLS